MIVVETSDEQDVIWSEAVRTLSTASPRAEISIEEVPAPARLAPHSVALSATVTDKQGNEFATGKFVVLHDPDGQPTWDGNFRIVTFVHADIEPDVITDELFDDVAWSWLTESLEQTSAEYSNLSGTVTRTASRSFADLADRARETQLEIRASWSPTTTNLASHLNSWCALLERSAGLEPLPEGVTPLSRKFS